MRAADVASVSAPVGSGTLPSVSVRYLKQRCPRGHWAQCRRYDQWSTHAVRAKARALVADIQQGHAIIQRASDAQSIVFL